MSRTHGLPSRLRVLISRQIDTGIAIRIDTTKDTQHDGDFEVCLMLELPHLPDDAAYLMFVVSRRITATATSILWMSEASSDLTLAVECENEQFVA